MHHSSNLQITVCHRMKQKEEMIPNLESDPSQTRFGPDAKRPDSTSRHPGETPFTFMVRRISTVFYSADLMRTMAKTFISRALEAKLFPLAEPKAESITWH